MNKIVKYTLAGIAGAMIIIQFIPAPLPATKDDNPDDIIQTGLVSSEVANVMKAACYDCHSNQTRYPWYSYVAPVSWLIKHDVEDGREELNFSEWATMPKRRVIKKLEEIGEMVQEGEMPLRVYKITHHDARLSEAQKNLIIEWAKATSERVMEN
jgi:hypothetical protein